MAWVGTAGRVRGEGTTGGRAPGRARGFSRVPAPGTTEACEMTQPLRIRRSSDAVPRATDAVVHSARAPQDGMHAAGTRQGLRPMTSRAGDRPHYRTLQIQEATACSQPRI